MLGEVMGFAQQMREGEAQVESAVPEVDELASVVLDLWAAEHGYTKLQPNLFGM